MNQRILNLQSSKACTTFWTNNQTKSRWDLTLNHKWMNKKRRSTRLRSKIIHPFIRCMQVWPHHNKRLFCKIALKKKMVNLRPRSLAKKTHSRHSVWAHTYNQVQKSKSLKTILRLSKIKTMTKIMMATAIGIEFFQIMMSPLNRSFSFVRPKSITQESFRRYQRTLKSALKSSREPLMKILNLIQISTMKITAFQE